MHFKNKKVNERNKRIIIFLTSLLILHLKDLQKSKVVPKRSIIMKSKIKLCLLAIVSLFLVVSCVPANETANRSPEDLARAYIAARNAYTMDTSIMTDDVKILELGDSLSVEDVASWLKYAKAQGFRWYVEGCETTDATQVDCRFTMANKVSDAFGYGQVDGGVFEFSVKDEKISKVNLDLDLSFWGPKVFRTAMDYIEANHSDNVGKLFTDKGTIGLSEEGLELWRIYTDEFVEVVKASNN